MAWRSTKLELKTAEQFQKMREAGLVLAAALDTVVSAVQTGISTQELDAIFAQELKSAGATSNFLGYHGYPSSICASVNDRVVHGIPNNRPIEAGDVVSIDGGAVVDGWHADSARSVVVGHETSKGQGTTEDLALMKTTRKAMWAGIAAMATGERVGDIGAAIDDYVAEVAPGRYGIVEEYTGHGIGTAMHMPPDVLNYRSRNRGPKLQPGMALAIEPILVRGDIATRTLADDWTVVTEDGSRAAHWEHSVALHEQGIWVLTAADGGAADLAEFGVTPTPLS